VLYRIDGVLMSDSEFNPQEREAIANSKAFRHYCLIGEHGWTMYVRNDMLTEDIEKQESEVIKVCPRHDPKTREYNII
jgi:hypothetical protein